MRDADHARVAAQKHVGPGRVQFLAQAPFQVAADVIDILLIY